MKERGDTFPSWEPQPNRYLDLVYPFDHMYPSIEPCYVLRFDLVELLNQDAFFLFASDDFLKDCDHRMPFNLSQASGVVAMKHFRIFSLPFNGRRTASILCYPLLSFVLCIFTTSCAIVFRRDAGCGLFLLGHWIATSR